MSTMTPREIVQELDKHIIGQKAAKRAVAIALRNRWRRQQVDAAMRAEITPRNILMIGPTGVGKTEIARRLARLANAPFIKVEATKFTEVGYVGRDVESIIRDLADVALKDTREREIERVRNRAEDAAEERVLDILLPGVGSGTGGDNPWQETDESSTRQKFRKRLREGQLDDKEIEIELTGPASSVEIMTPPGMEEMSQQLQSMFQNLGSGRSSRKKLKIRDAMKHLVDEEAVKLLNEDELKALALESVEQNGIVFIDEIDKIAKNGERTGSGEVSREGVQRDLLPLVEGCTVSTRFGMVNTDHILFIACGAFHVSKPSDLVPELQGRLPIRVELDALGAGDFERILREPDHSLTDQAIALLSTEGVTLAFTDSGIERIAAVAFEVNESTENIGARRLHTVMERLLEELSFEASDLGDSTVTVDADYVNQHLGDLVQDVDLSRYIL